MLRRAFASSPSGSSLGNSRRCNNPRFCFGFGIALLLSLGIIVYTWSAIIGPSNSVSSSGRVPLSVGKDSDVISANSEIILGPLVTVPSKRPGEAMPSKKLTIEIYYETICPDSIYFILRNFAPLYQELSDYISPVFVPYGKASTSTRGGEITFDCQHGETECQGNMVHACAVAHITDEAVLTKYIACMINDNRNPEGAGEKCASEQGIDWDPIRECWKGERGRELLKNYGKMTHDLRPSVSFIPTIVVNKSQDGQRNLLKDLKSFFCRLLRDERPSKC